MIYSTLTGNSLLAGVQTGAQRPTPILKNGKFATPDAAKPEATAVAITMA